MAKSVPPLPPPPLTLAAYSEFRKLVLEMEKEAPFGIVAEAAVPKGKKFSDSDDSDAKPAKRVSNDISSDDSDD
jgi:hypothetical protein